MFLSVILIPACASSSPAFLIMYSAYKLNKQGDNIQPWYTILPLPIWKQSVVPCPILTLSSWPAYRFIRRQVRWSGIPFSLRIFQFVVIHTFKGFGIVNKEEVDVFLENISGFWTYNFHNFLLNYRFLCFILRKLLTLSNHFWENFTPWNNESHSAKLYILFLSFCIWIYRNTLSYEKNLQPIILVQRNLSNMSSLHLGKMSVSSTLFCKENQIWICFEPAVYLKLVTADTLYTAPFSVVKYI